MASFTTFLTVLVMAAFVLSATSLAHPAKKSPAPAAYAPSPAAYAPQPAAVRHHSPAPYKAESPVGNYYAPAPAPVSAAVALPVAFTVGSVALFGAAALLF